MTFCRCHFEHPRSSLISGMMVGFVVPSVLFASTVDADDTALKSPQSYRLPVRMSVMNLSAV